jgi:ribosome-binding protein aMBF1 (putative translation factor)
MQARFLYFELPEDWETQSLKTTKKKSRQSQRQPAADSPGKAGRARSPLSSQQIINARKKLRLSQRDLANHVGKSQSWVRDIESGRLQVGFKEQQILAQVLGVSP